MPWGWFSAGSALMAAAVGLCAAGLAQSSGTSAEGWPGTGWDKPLGTDYDQWKPLRDVLLDFARRAGGVEVEFAEEAKQDFVVPLPAKLTLREAFTRAAAIHALDVVVRDGKLAVVKGRRMGSWLDLVGGEAVPVVFDDVRGSLYLPREKKFQGPTPWVWYAPNGIGPMHAWLARRLFAEGIGLATVRVGESQGNPEGRAIFTRFHDKLVAEHGMARRAVLLPQSRGGLMLYNWAAEHPDRVAAVGGIYTVCDLRSYPGLARAAEAYHMTPEELEGQLSNHNPIDRLEPLVKAGIPIFHLHGDNDRAVPLEKNAGELVRRYKALGGQAELVVVPGGGHEVTPRFFRSNELADFLTRQARTVAAADSQSKEKP